MTSLRRPRAVDAVVVGEAPAVAATTVAVAAQVDPQAETTQVETPVLVVIAAGITPVETTRAETPLEAIAVDVAVAPVGRRVPDLNRSFRRARLFRSTTTL